MFYKDMSILEALQAHPRAKEIFVKHGMACLSCMGAVEESIEAGAQMHGIDINTLLEELNQLPEKNS